VGFDPSSTDVVITPSVICEFVDCTAAGAPPPVQADEKSIAANTRHVNDIANFIVLLR
jgi:hypothetical protein